MLHDATREPVSKLSFVGMLHDALMSHYTKASRSETKKRKVRDAKVFNTNLNSPRRDDVGDGRLVS